MQYTPVITWCLGSKGPYRDIRESWNSTISRWPPLYGPLLFHRPDDEFHIIFINFSHLHQLYLYFNTAIITFQQTKYILFIPLGHTYVFYLLFIMSLWAIIQDIENTFGSTLECYKWVRVLTMHVIPRVDCMYKYDFYYLIMLILWW